MGEFQILGRSRCWLDARRADDSRPRRPWRLYGGRQFRQSLAVLAHPATAIAVSRSRHAAGEPDWGRGAAIAHQGGRAPGTEVGACCNKRPAEMCRGCIRLPWLNFRVLVTARSSPSGCCTPGEQPWRRRPDLHHSSAKRTRIDFGLCQFDDRLDTD